MTALAFTVTLVPSALRAVTPTALSPSMISPVAVVLYSTSTPASARAFSHSVTRSSSGFLIRWKPPFSSKNGVSKRKLASIMS